MDSKINKITTTSFWRSFPRRHPILFNFCLIILTGCVLVWIALIALDIWTDHGHYQTVPSVKGMSYDRAVDELNRYNLTATITDSIYDSSIPPGTVTEQSPRPETKVKTKRSVYLTISAFTPKTVSLPNLIDTSVRQARSTLEGLGFLYINEVSVASEYKDLVLGVRFNGVPVQPGTRIPVSATVTLEVGMGFGESTDTTETLTEDYGIEIPESDF
ncbi:MAG: PASTA domain-containing protein [Muribaculum sp.]|nr:PASTA domain-containing protein [Muribaculum sp.]